MHDYLIPLVNVFVENADEENAEAMANYMRDRFPFLGIKSPERKALVKQYTKAHGLPPVEDLEEITRQLWALDAREFQYVALSFLDRLNKRLEPGHVPLLEDLITTKSWWDTVDMLASHQVGGLIRRHPELEEEVIGRWRGSDDIWLRRTTLLFQLGYKDQTDQALLFGLIEQNLGSDEFFINKAIGWALREYSKTDAQAVVEFVNQTELAPLSEREALKWMMNKGMINN